MKALRVVLLILAALLAIYLILCLAGPKRIDVTRTATIDAAPATIFSTISDLKTWKEWSAWLKMDPDATLTFSDKSAGLGASYSWDGEKTGKGTLEIIEAEPNTSMKTKIQFTDWEGHSYGSWKLEPTENGGTEVSWGIAGDSDIPFLVRGMMMVMGMEKSIAKDFDTGLANLKTYCEALPEPTSASSTKFDVQEVEFGTRHYAVIKRTVAFPEMQTFYAEAFPQVVAATQNTEGLEMTGMPCGLYYSWDEANGKTDMAAGVPVNKMMEMQAPIEVVKIEAPKAFLINYYGGYDNIGAAHMAMDEYLKANNIEAGTPAIEEYVTDPMTEPDATKWLTKIYYLAKS